VENFKAMLTALGIKVLYAERSNSVFHDSFAKSAQILFIHRSGYTEDLARLIHSFKSKGKPVVYDTDDLVIHTENVPRILSAHGSPVHNEETLKYWFSYVSRHQAIIEMVDHVTASTDEISEFATAKFSIPSTSIKNFPSVGQFSVSESIKQKAPRAQVSSIGYFSGSPSHRLDFQLVEGALGKMTHQGKMRLVLAGFVNPQGNGILHEPRVKYLGLTDSEKLIRNISTVDLNIAPLRRSQFTDCKSALKIFDAALAGVFTFASPSREYLDFSARTGHRFSQVIDDSDWLDALQEAARHGVPRVSTYEARNTMGKVALTETIKLAELCSNLV
jgi:hypothetical protein